jgi:hypothetical protein
MNEDAVDYTSGPYQQFTEEPRMQELDIIDEKEEPVQNDFIPKTKKRGTTIKGTKKRGTKKRVSKKGGKKKKASLKK